MPCPICKVEVSSKNYQYHVNNCIAKQERMKVVEETANFNNKKMRIVEEVEGENLAIPYDSPLANSSSSSGSETSVKTAATTTATTSINTEDWSFLIRQSTVKHSHPVPGLYIFPDFLTPEEETSLLADLVDPTKETQRFSSEKYLNGHHLNMRWGFHPNSEEEERLICKGTPSQPLPDYITSLLLPKLSPLFSIVQGLRTFNMTEANAIEYDKHSPNLHDLKFHMDDRVLSKNFILNLSLKGDCKMSYKCEKLPSNQGLKRVDYIVGEERKVELKRRTLQIMSGESRYNWKHGIYHEDLLDRKRVSITFRETSREIPVNAPPINDRRNEEGEEEYGI